MTYIIVLTVIWVVDTVLLATWNPYYFRFGVPVYRKTLPISSNTSAYLQANGFPWRANAVLIDPSMKAKALGKHELAMREPICIEYLTYERFVHGYLVYNVDSNRLELRLSANMFTTILYLTIIVVMIQALLRMLQTDAVAACLIFILSIMLWAFVIWMLRRNISEFTAIVQDVLEYIGSHKHHIRDQEVPTP